MSTGIKAKHLNPELEPGEYIVTVTTKGGAAIVNGESDCVYRALYELWEAITVNHQVFGADVAVELAKWSTVHRELNQKNGKRMACR